MENTKIEWATHTFNPWIGCTQVSPGCLHCYAETRDKRHLIEKVDHWGKGAPRLRTSPANWRKPLQWNREYEKAIARHRTMMMVCDKPPRPRVFCASLADWLDEEVPVEWLADLLKVIHDTPNLDWLLLTKRPENWERRMREVAECRTIGNHAGAWMALGWGSSGTIPANVWVGTTVEDQTRADHRLPELLKIPAKIRFLSCEPLLEKVLLDNGENSWLSCCGCSGESSCRSSLTFGRHFHGIDWVICGGESGTGARPMHPDWARALRDQCMAAGVAFHFKQWGEFVDSDNMPPETECPDDAGFCAFPDGTTLWCVGKRFAGRLLDGREWNEVPSP